MKGPVKKINQPIQSSNVEQRITSPKMSLDCILQFFYVMLLLLVFFKCNLRRSTLYFSVTSYFEKILRSAAQGKQSFFGTIVIVIVT